MDIEDFYELLEKAEASEGSWNPKVFIKIGTLMVPVHKIEHSPESNDFEEAIIIS